MDVQATFGPVSVVCSWMYCVDVLCDVKSTKAVWYKRHLARSVWYVRGCTVWMYCVDVLCDVKSTKAVRYKRHLARSVSANQGFWLGAKGGTD